MLWVCWTTNFLITSIFYILSFATCANLVKSYKVIAGTACSRSTAHVYSSALRVPPECV